MSGAKVVDSNGRKLTITLMQRFVSPWCWVIALLAVMAALMAGPVREESATVDEPVNLAAGYLYWTGQGTAFNPEHPPLGQMLTAMPLLFLDLNVPEYLEQLGELRVGAPNARPWRGWETGKAEQYYRGGRTNWYYWPYWEAGIYGQELLYGGWNDPEIILWASRSVQVGLSLLTGLVIAFWLRKSAGTEAALLGVVLWVLNPIALAFGHLVVNDISVTFGMTLTIWMFVRFLETPKWQTALLAGVATGLALVMKFTALLLAPIFLALAISFLCQDRGATRFWKWLPLLAAGAWLVVLAVYAPHWKPAPPLSPEEAARIGVPVWFQQLRPLLVPPGFFKGIAMQAEHAAFGHEAFLSGEWRLKGWWYYFPLALVWKLPVPLLLLTLAGGGLWMARLRRGTFGEAAPWVAALVYLALAMTSSINIGVRYLLPMLPLLAVGAAQQLARLTQNWRVMAWVLCGWLAISTALAYPHYIEYFNEFAGGTRNGYRRLVDSNYDWGQDAKRLHHWLSARGNPKIYLRCVSPVKSLQHYQIRYEATVPERIRQASDGLLVISATILMKPDWRWLREERQPVDRIGQALFVYDLSR